MDAALKTVFLCLLLALTGCVRTVIPYTQQHSPYETYQVRTGDTLASIGRRYQLDYQVLARRNHLRAPYTIYTGQQIYLWGEAPRSSYLPIEEPAKQAHVGSANESARKGKVSVKKERGAKLLQPGQVSLIWPLRGKVTTRFGRSHGQTHDGIDIAAKEGTPVHAAAAGEVVYADDRVSGYGHLIILRHSLDMFTAYAHNQRNLVSQGDYVKQGDIIARVGQTGRASGSHLHFEVRRGPTPVDPLAYLPKR
jgi:murein DD-endopeptidase MepM/ murein hydrolase activator NlpD